VNRSRDTAEARSSAPITVQRPPKVAKDPLRVLMVRYADLEPLAARRTLLLSGAVVEEVLTSFGREAKEPAVWLGVLELEPLLAAAAARTQEKMLLGRRLNRLGEAKASTPLSDLGEEDMRILRMSQKEYNSFRARQ